MCGVGATECAEVEGTDAALRVECDSRSIHPWQHLGNGDPIGLQHPLEQILLEHDVALDEQKGLVDLFPGKPQGVDVVGSLVQWIGDVADLHGARVIAKVVLYRVRLMSDHDDQTREPIGVQAADQTLQNGDNADADQALGGRVRQRREPASGASGQQQRGPYLFTSAYWAAAEHVPPMSSSTPIVPSIDGRPIHIRAADGPPARQDAAWRARQAGS